MNASKITIGQTVWIGGRFHVECGTVTYRDGSKWRVDGEAIAWSFYAEELWPTQLKAHLSRIRWLNAEVRSERSTIRNAQRKIKFLRSVRRTAERDIARIRKSHKKAKP